MKTKLTNLALALTVTLPARGQDRFTPAQLAERTVERRAVEAVIWGMPAVNFERILQEAIRNGAAANQIVYWSRPANDFQKSKFNETERNQNER